MHIFIGAKEARQKMRRFAHGLHQAKDVERLTQDRVKETEKRLEKRL